MKCLPYVDLETDTAFWVSKDKFYACFDQHDFNFYREVKSVTQGYLKDWFYTSPDGNKFFILPTVQFVNNKTQFISGRHRIAVLLEHLNELPFAFAQPLDGDMAQILNIVDRRVNLNESIQIPDLQKYDTFVQ